MRTYKDNELEELFMSVTDRGYLPTFQLEDVGLSLALIDLSTYTDCLELLQ